MTWPAALACLDRYAATPGAVVEATSDGGGRITTPTGRVLISPSQWWLWNVAREGRLGADPHPRCQAAPNGTQRPPKRILEALQPSGSSA